MPTPQADGHTNEEIATARHRKRCKEQLTMYKLMSKHGGDSSTLSEREQVECGIGQCDNHTPHPLHCGLARGHCNGVGCTNRRIQGTAHPTSVISSR